ncbi:MAG: gamma-glutamyltransferase family protein [Pseudomonadota bacterium]|nr:gamma-glutamyltransferase family protein [Pseudomonadota bacterium]
MFTTRPEIVGTFGVAASTHWLATQTAMGVLERGGNAFDAAATAGFVLQVVEPHLNGPGGEVPILLWSNPRRAVEVVCGQGSAPAAAEPAYFRRLGLDLVPGIGLLPAPVPGAFGAWLRMLRDHGSWPLADVLAPAIGYARDGFPLLPRVVQAVLAVRPLFLTEWQTSAALWMPDGRVPQPGSLFTNPALAATYSRVLEEAAKAGTQRVRQINAAHDAWYRGFVALEIDAFCRRERVRDTTGERHAGLLCRDDMAQWEATVEQPVTIEFGRFTVAKCGPWSQGITLLQQLGMLDAASLQRCAPDSAEFVHRIAEAAKLAMADRLAWLGDPLFADVPVDALLDRAYLAARAALIGKGAARLLQPGSPGGRTPCLPDLLAAQRSLAQAETRFGVGEPTFAELPPPSEWAAQELFVGETCHVDVIDRHGNMVSATPSGGWLSSSPTIPALGFALSTRLQTTWLDPGLPNTLAPGKRPCTTLSPSLALRDGEPYMVFGTPGGDQQDQWQAAFFLRHAVHGMNLQECIDAPAWHVEHFPSSFWPRQTTLNGMALEGRFPPATIDELRRRGHEARVGGDWSEGRLSACSREGDTKGRLLLRAAANPRGMQGYAAGR